MSFVIRKEDLINAINNVEEFKGDFENMNRHSDDIIEVDEDEYCKYDIDLLGVPLDAKFKIRFFEDGKEPKELKIVSIGKTIDEDIFLLTEEVK